MLMILIIIMRIIILTYYSMLSAMISSWTILSKLSSI